MLGQVNPVKATLFANLLLLACSSVSHAQTVLDETIVSNIALIRIDDGDFVHPAFSPSGKRLAYAKVVIEDNTEFTEVYVYEFASNKTQRLLDAKNSREYATYKAFVYRLEWTANDRLLAYVSDGDVDTTLVNFNVTNGSIIDASYDESGEMAWYAKIDDWIQSVDKLPDWEPAVVHNAFQNGYRLTDGSFLIQPHYAGVTSNLFHLTQKGKLTRLTKMQESDANGLGGGLVFNGRILFVLAESRGGNSRQADLLLYDNGQTETLDSIATLTEPDMKVLSVNNKSALFFVSTGYSYQRSPGILYEYSSAGLRAWPAPGDLYDVEIDNTGNKLALVFWQGDRRVIEVRQIGRKVP